MKGSSPLYSLKLLDIDDGAEYLACSRRSAREVAARKGRVIALDKFRETMKGDIMNKI
jgi:hypothetical protein